MSLCLRFDTFYQSTQFDKKKKRASLLDILLHENYCTSDKQQRGMLDAFAMHFAINYRLESPLQLICLCIISMQPIANAIYKAR